MRCYVLSAAVLGIIVVAAFALPQGERVSPGEEELDLGIGVEEEPLDDLPPAKPSSTARSARRRGSSSRTKAPSKAANDNGGDGAAVAATTAHPTSSEKPTKRVRTTTASSSSKTTTKAPAGEGEEPVSTYKRPKFPPRRLPPPTQKPAITDEVLDETGGVEGELHSATGDEAQGGVPEEPIDEEPLVDDEVRRR